MAVTAYGKHYSWEDSLFYAGHKKDENANYVRILGHRLEGLRYRDPMSTPEADFSLASGVYLLHATDGEIVYVGQARQLAARLVAHTGDHLRGRWTHYTWFTTSELRRFDHSQGVSSEKPEVDEQNDVTATISLNMLEAILRTAIEPRLNLQSGRWGNTPMFAQSVEYRFTYLREVYDQNRKIRKMLKALTRKEP